MVSWYSFLSAVVFYNLALIIVFMLRHNTAFLVKHSTSSLLFLSILALIRMLLPFDQPYSYVIQSDVILPAVQRFFNIELITGIVWSSIDHLLISIWVLGAVAFSTGEIYSLMRSRKVRQGYVLVNNEQTQRIVAEFGAKYTVLVSPNVQTPYVSGLFKHTIYVPILNLTDDELRFIFRHEIQHILFHDSLIKLLYCLLASLFWWNPVARIFRREIDALLELRCDARLTEPLDDTGRNEYLHMLLSVMRQISGRQQRIPLNESAAVRTTSALKQRFEVIISHEQHKPKRVNVALSCCLLVLFLLSYMVILQPAFEPPADEIKDAFELTAENAYIMTVDDRYYLFVNDAQWAELEPEELDVKPYCDLTMIEGGK